MRVAFAPSEMLRVTRLTTTERASALHLLRLDGRITGPWVDELRRACEAALGSDSRCPPRLVLDLTGVSFIDRDGIALLRQLAALPVLFTNGSAFITQQLKEVTDVDR